MGTSRHGVDRKNFISYLFQGRLGTQPAFCPAGRLGRWLQLMAYLHLTLKVTNEWSYTSTPVHVIPGIVSR
jgi:hypothetical protein